LSYFTAGDTFNRAAAMKCLLLILSSFVILHSSLSAKPNVILFLVDDMGWMDCGVYGSQYYETPNIDRFAKRAMRFTNAYSQPLCSPTRGSLLTGQYSARHKITSATGHQPPQPAGHVFLPETAAPTQPMLTPESKNYLEPSQITLAETLKGAGYRTAHIGKWHLGLTQPHWPEQQGFDVAFHCHPDPGPPGNYFSPYGVTAEGVANAKNKVGTITDGPEGGGGGEVHHREQRRAVFPESMVLWRAWAVGAQGGIHEGFHEQKRSERPSGESDHGVDAEERGRVFWSYPG
jgi:arylsulfatase A-like enzyme